MDTTLARPPIGRLIDGRYRVESLIARGGMATVYLGTDTRLDRTVALKIMHAELANDEDFVRRFVVEARSIARLSHPNVVTLFDQGTDGRTLRDLLNERGRLGPDEALDIMDGVLAGLAAAHDAGIAHRDVKPENVLLTDSMVIKVADFGLARLLAGVSETKSGMIIGTAAYLAPEQVAGQTADARTDVYAAGVMLFELLTGTQPHTGDTPLAVAYKHVNEVVPPPSSVVPGLPSALDTLVALATSRDPELRPGDAGQFLRAVTGVRHALPPAGPGHELVPGMAPPARQSFGSPYPGAGPASATQQFQPAPHQPGSQHTLIVSTGAADPPYGRARPHYGQREPRLQRLLFSRRLAYLAVAFAAVLLVGVAAWWLTTGRYTDVPKVTGMTVAAARAELSGAGFTVTTASPRLDNQFAKGQVISSAPPTGSA